LVNSDCPSSALLVGGIPPASCHCACVSRGMPVGSARPGRLRRRAHAMGWSGLRPN